MKYIISFVVIMMLVSCNEVSRKNQIYDLLKDRETTFGNIGDNSEWDKIFYKIVKLYNDLSVDDKIDVQSSVSGNNKILIQIVDMYCEKWRIIQDGWSRDFEYYQSIRQEIASTLPKDRGQHTFRIQWDGGRPKVVLVPEIPGGRCESDWYGCGMILPSGDLEAYYIFSDMGHAGVWGVVITPRVLKEEESIPGDEMIGSLFVRLGKRIHPGFYEAENNLD